jgi:chromosome segregation protein
VETEAEARAAIAQLRAEDKGHACFVVRERLPERLASAAPPGGTPPDGTTALRTHVRTSGANAHLADVLLQHHFLASTLDAAQSAAADAPPLARIVTPTGEWVDARGLLNGGSQQEATSPVASRLGRQEQLEAARQQRDAAAATCQKRQEAVDAATAALQAIDLHPYREAVRSAEQTLRQAEKEWERVQYEQETLADRRDELQERRATLEAEQAALAERIDELRAEVQDVQDTVDRLQAQYADASTALDAAEDRERTAVEAYSDANVAAVEARNRLQNLERDHTRTQERIATIDRQQAQRAESIASLKATIEDALDTQTTLDERIDDLREDRQAYEDAVDAAADAVHDAKAEIADVESELRRLRDEREQAVRQENDAAVRRAEIETRIEDLVESTQDDIGRNLVDNPASLPDDFDATAVEENVRSLRGRINAIGSVNALALDEYASEKERLDFLEEQQADLAAAEEKVLETIQEINTTASERFFETFDAIQESFGILFTELFGEGASAELQLEDPGDPLDTAIEIVAQPRGKRPVTLSQLSSGEKTLTAIALLFAIYLVKPSPFCILDEVDAPLDDANVERFMHLVRRFEDDTQFILVTHNQRTMALADRLYGVTMEEQGISTLVGVAFDEAVEMAG